jgi:hypothetical protein
MMHKYVERLGAGLFSSKEHKPSNYQLLYSTCLIDCLGLGIYENKSPPKKQRQNENRKQKVFQRPETPLSIKLSVLQIASTIVHILYVLSPALPAPTRNPRRQTMTAIFQALSLSVCRSARTTLHLLCYMFPSHQRAYFRVNTVQ